MQQHKEDKIVAIDYHITHDLLYHANEEFRSYIHSNEPAEISGIKHLLKQKTDFAYLGVKFHADFKNKLLTLFMIDKGKECPVEFDMSGVEFDAVAHSNSISRIIQTHMYFFLYNHMIDRDKPNFVTE